MIARTIVLAVVLVLFGTRAYADECNSLRYSDNFDGAITDCRTGLIWLKDTNCTDSLGLTGIDKSSGYLTWYDALTWVAALGGGACGLTDGSYAGDWRLPTKTEWMAMVANAIKQIIYYPSLTNGAGTAQWTNGDIFYNVQLNNYWSSITFPGHAGDYSWCIDMQDGNVGHGCLKTQGHYVWPVRGGQSGSFGNLTIQ